MDIRWLRYFVAVYEEGSVSGAARRLFVAQPSISTTLAQLEEHLGAELFVRHRKGVTPTDEGRSLYGTATRLIGEMQALEKLFHPSAETMTLSLAVAPTVNARRMASFVKRLLEQSEGLALRLVETGEAADARIVPEMERGQEEEFAPLWEERYVLALPVGHPLGLAAAVKVGDLAGARLIERCQCEMQDQVAAVFARRKIRPEIVARAQNEEWAVALVSAGLGAAFLPEGSVENEAGVITRALADLALSRRVGLAYNPADARRRELRAAISLARSAAYRPARARPRRPSGGRTGEPGRRRTASS